MRFEMKLDDLNWMTYWMTPSESQRLADCTAIGVLSDPCDHHHPQDETVINLAAGLRSQFVAIKFTADPCKRFVGWRVICKDTDERPAREGARAAGTARSGHLILSTTHLRLPIVQEYLHRGVLIA